MAKNNLKPLKVCKLCEEKTALGIVQTAVTGLVNKKPVTGFCCLGCVGKAICGWKEINKA